MKLKTESNAAGVLQLPATVARGCRVLAGLCLLLAVGLPVLTAVAVWPMGPADMLVRAGLVAAAQTTSAGLDWGSALHPHGQRVVLGGVLLLPVLLQAWALASLARGFGALGRGDAGWVGAHAALCRFAGLTVLATLAAVVVGTVAGVVLTWQYPPGTRQLAVAVSSAHAQAVLMAGLVWVFAHVLLRAKAVADENAAFV